MWTERVRSRAVGALPPEKLLPDRQPAYVSSWIYVFGVATIAALVVVVGSGVILGLKGPAWWHVSGVGQVLQQHPPLGRSRSSSSRWSCTSGGSSSWAPGAAAGAWTWVTGAVVFLVSIGTAFTGYLSQQNFDSQWIASEGKDGLNSVGIGAFFNVVDFGQMYTWHVILLPVAVVGARRRARPPGPEARRGAALCGQGRQRRRRRRETA